MKVWIYRINTTTFVDQFHGNDVTLPRSESTFNGKVEDGITRNNVEIWIHRKVKSWIAGKVDSEMNPWRSSKWNNQKSSNPWNTVDAEIDPLVDIQNSTLFRRDIVVESDIPTEFDTKVEEPFQHQLLNRILHTSKSMHNLIQKLYRMTSNLAISIMWKKWQIWSVNICFEENPGIAAKVKCGITGKAEKMESLEKLNVKLCNRWQPPAWHFSVWTHQNFR